MKQSNSADSHITYDPALIKEASPVHFSALYWQKNNAIIGSAKGRGTTWFIQLEKLQGALRHYQRGGLFGRIIKDHYLFLGWSKTRSLQEFSLLNFLIQQGVHVPRPIAALAIKKRFTYQADLITEKINEAQDLVSILQETTLDADIYKKIGQEIAKMHQAQVNHSDLNIHNILIDANKKVWIIDFDKCAKQHGNAWKSGNLQRLKRSFLKEQKKRNILWSNNDWEILKEAYLVASAT
ncbi:3-deoxy-D-manno-octulosonic-acid kinase [Psychromonas sp. CNPT3]|uniref:3-deoxy-D-manno-octulosonic acid kinase n=1 Tax=Psychromonas sp. CNPT3 TaxID=314282 RepID=UPI00006E581C|nr:3-deoxy-D-manno-octulosonic acid kinase [Psychromonas sp. CNPT3]AGH80464.1 3-deoxy-D-manno-octulosonic-acid kinase [Psychromonas sp. CNPT3]